MTLTRKEQNRRFLREYIKAKERFPWIAVHAQKHAIECLQEIGGIAGTWRTDYSECTFHYPVRMADGKLHDMSTVEKVRAYYENGGEKWSYK